MDRDKKLAKLAAALARRPAHQGQAVSLVSGAGSGEFASRGGTDGRDVTQPNQPAAL